MRVLITGANRGIGLHLAKGLAARGDVVIGAAREAGAAEDVIWAGMDVTNSEQIRAVAAAHREPLDLLICNAGVYLDKLQNLDTGFDADLWAKSFAVNVTGVFLTVQAFLPQLRAAPAAKIAILSSIMGSSARAPGGSFAYRASKAAVTNLGRNLAAELRPEGVAVGIFHPGWVQTQMGGSVADLTVSQSVSGLIARVDALSLSTTGVFETWDGQPLDY